jgi:hypothetical protein
MEGRSFVRAFEIKRYIKGDVKNALYSGISLHRGPIGEPGGDSLARTF